MSQNPLTETNYSTGETRQDLNSSKKATILRVVFPDKDEFNNAAYFFYKVEKKEDNNKEENDKNNKDILKISDTVEIDLSGNALLPDQTYENTAPLFKNYTDCLPDLENDPALKDAEPSPNLEKWKVIQSTEKQKTKPGFFTSRSIKRIRPPSTVRKTDYTLPVKPQKSLYTLGNESLRQLSNAEIKLEEGHTIKSTRLKTSNLRFSIQPREEKGFKGLIMPILEPLIQNSQAYKKLSLVNLQKKSGSITVSRATLTKLSKNVSGPKVTMSSRDSFVAV